MRSISKVWFALVVVALFEGVAFAASFTASLDRDSIMQGESATLSLSFEGATPGTVPSPSVPGLQISQNGTSQSYVVVNGSMTATLTVTFSVTSQRSGQYTIPALTAAVGGQKLSTSPLTLTVGTPSAPSAAAVNAGNEVAFLRFTFPKNKIYVGEPAVGCLELFLRDDVTGLNGFQLTGSPTDGFNAGKPAETQRYRAQIGNHVYTVIPLTLPLTPVRSGPLTLGPFTVNVVVVLPGQNQGGDPFMRQFINQGEQRQMALASDPVNVTSLALPEDNKPANFTGAVGNFTMSATAGPTTVTAGDPITVRVKISGSGSLDSLTLPTQDAWQNFKTYPPTSKLETSDQFGFQGTKTFEQIISPLNADVHELPSLHFSFFNPTDGQYHSLKSVAVPLVVQAAGATPIPALAAGRTSPDSQTAPDLLPIRENLGALISTPRPLVGNPVFLAAQTVPVTGFIAAFVWRKRTDNLANNPRLRRQRAVAILIANGMNDLKKYAAANQPEEFFATLFRLLQEQLGERLDCPASAITENVLDSHALLRTAPPATRDGLHELFQLCNQARYAPVRGTSELNSVAAQFEKNIDQLQELKA